MDQSNDVLKIFITAVLLVDNDDNRKNLIMPKNFLSEGNEM